MFDELSVAENIFMGHMPRPAASIDWGEMRRRERATCSSASRPISTPRRRCKHLSIAQKHLVEIARALSHDARVVIMDEPTAALSRNEIDDLFRIVAQLKAEGTRHPLHHAQVRRDLPRRRPLRRAARRRVRRRGPHRGRRAKPSSCA